MREAVKETSHIRFNKEYKTFSLHAGSSMYVFCIGPELTLEHLYWGVKLESGYDLRYLSQSMRHSHFTTVEAAPMSGKICSNAETLEEVQKTWKDNNSMGRRVPISDMAAVQRKRLENYSWRILSKATQDGNGNTFRTTLSTPRRCDKTKASKMMRAASNEVAAAMDLASSLDNLGRSTEPGVAAGLRQSVSKLSNFLGKANISTVATPPPAPVLLGTRRSRKPHQAFERTLGKIGKGALCCEYADYGTGDFRSPSFVVVDNLNGSSISPLRYKRHAIYSGKLPMPDSMPAIRCHSEREASTLVVTMTDAITGLEVDLVYGTRLLTLCNRCCLFLSSCWTAV
jgi:hypothetical protein